LRAAFILFDLDGNGTISFEEIQYLLSGITGTIDQTKQDEIIEMLAKSVGQNNEGELRFEQFKKLMYDFFLSEKPLQID
jgi:Ca2+-binding EF-hand superfamily protein